MNHVLRELTVELWLRMCTLQEKFTALLNVGGGRNLLSLAGMLLAGARKKLHSFKMRYLAYSEFPVFLCLRCNYESESSLWHRELWGILSFRNSAFRSVACILTFKNEREVNDMLSNTSFQNVGGKARTWTFYLGLLMLALCKAVTNNISVIFISILNRLR